MATIAPHRDGDAGGIFFMLFRGRNALEKFPRFGPIYDKAMCRIRIDELSKSACFEALRGVIKSGPVLVCNLKCRIHFPQTNWVNLRIHGLIDALN